MPVTLRICSDLHLEHAPLPAVPPGADSDIVVLAGDISCHGAAAIEWMLRPEIFGRARAILYVPGNHEYYDGVLPDALVRMREAAAGSRVHVMDNDRLVLDGVRYLACTLWSDFELRIGSGDDLRVDPRACVEASLKYVMDYRCIRVDDGRADEGGVSALTSEPRSADRLRLLRPADTVALHRRDRAWLQAALEEPFDGPTVVVTHMAPHRGSLAPRWAADPSSGAFVSELPEAFFAVPALWVHGHTHTSFDYRVGSCRVLCNPRGYVSRRTGDPENPAFDPGFTATIAT
jgi:hypothetical protein